MTKKRRVGFSVGILILGCLLFYQSIPPSPLKILPTANKLTEQPPPKAPLSASIQTPQIEVKSENTNQIRYEQLRRKVLKTADEKVEYSKLATDPLMIQQSLAVLNEFGSIREWSEPVLKKRLAAVNFLKSSLLEESRQGAQFAAGHVEDWIRQVHWSAKLPIAVRKVVAGDLMELFVSLRLRHPEKAEALVRDLQGSPKLQLLEFATNSTSHVQRMLGEI